MQTEYTELGGINWLNAWLNFDLLFSMKDFRQLPKKKKKKKQEMQQGI